MHKHYARTSARTHTHTQAHTSTHVRAGGRAHTHTAHLDARFSAHDNQICAAGRPEQCATRCTCTHVRERVLESIVEHMLYYALLYSLIRAIVHVDLCAHEHILVRNFFPEAM